MRKLMVFFYPVSFATFPLPNNENGQKIKNQDLKRTHLNTSF